MQFSVLLLIITAPAMTAQPPSPSCVHALHGDALAADADTSKMSAELQQLWNQDFDLTGRSLFIMLPEMPVRQIRALAKKAGAKVAMISPDSNRHETLVRIIGNRASYAALSRLPEVRFMGLNFFMRRGFGEPFPALLYKCSTAVYRWFQGGSGMTMRVTLRTNLGTSRATIQWDFALILGPSGTYALEQGSLYEGPHIVTTITRAQAEQIHNLVYVDSLAP